MSRCLLGSTEDDHTIAPPCEQCTALSNKLYAGAKVQGFTYKPDDELLSALESLSVAEMESF